MKIVFVDWHNTLCHQPFWHKLLEQQTHRLHSQALYAVDVLFGQSQRETTLQWMRGAYTTQQMLESIDASGELYQAMLDNCKKMSVGSQLLQALMATPDDVQVAIATDNMDVFEVAYPELPTKDFPLLCSSQLGVLKSESAVGFFGKFLAEHDSDFSKALLIDDSPANLRAFRRLGGTTILYRDDEQAVSALNEWLQR
jgi:FMN phosphatase YigB (HAD superfamily)